MTPYKTNRELAQESLQWGALENSWGAEWYTEEYHRFKRELADTLQAEFDACPACGGSGWAYGHDCTSHVDGCCPECLPLREAWAKLNEK